MKFIFHNYHITITLISGIFNVVSIDLMFHFLPVPPSIDEANLVDNPRVVLNRTVLLECPVEGIPPPKVTWLKNGIQISSGNGISIKVLLTCYFCGPVVKHVCGYSEIDKVN